MTIKYLSGDRVSGLSTDTKPTMADGSVFIETDTGKRFIEKTSGTWEEVSGGTTLVPLAVTSLTTGSITTTTIRAAWASYANDGITGYRVEYQPEGGSWAEATASTTDLFYVVTGLSVYVQYHFRITAINGIGNSPTTTTGALTRTLGITPAVPTSLVATANTLATSMDLVWVASATGTPTPTYKVEYKLSSAGSWSVSEASQAGVTKTVTGLTEYTDYDFRVSGVNAHATSSPITVSTIKTNGVVPAQITGLTLTNAKPDVTMVWTADTAGIPSAVTYTVEHSLSGTGSWTTVNTTTTQAMTDSAVTLDVAHYYRVKGTNVQGAGTYSANSVITVPSFVATGGTETTFSHGGNTYKTHQLTTSSQTFVVTTGNKTINYAVVGAGGGGGGGFNTGAGGGGAGGFQSGTFAVSAGSSPYAVTIGTGGATAGTGSRGNNGTSSTGFGVTSAGGGGGGARSQSIGNTHGRAGGSGGGGGSTWGGQSFQPLGGSGTGGQGNSGGSSVNGDAAPGLGNKRGGYGTNDFWIDSTATGAMLVAAGYADGYIAGGGGGCASGSANGGGGVGASGSSVGNQFRGDANSGGGGGGGGETSMGAGNEYDGGTGVVLVWYQT